MDDTIYDNPLDVNQITISNAGEFNIVATYSASIPKLPDGMSLRDACLTVSLVCEDDKGNNITPELQSEWVSCENCNCGNGKDGARQ